METIFDYNPTDMEIQRWVYAEDPIEKERQRRNFKKELEESPDDSYFRLGMLFAGRGNMKKANEYWAKVKNKRMLDILIQDF
jgi:hypothetical protein